MMENKQERNKKNQRWKKGKLLERGRSVRVFEGEGFKLFI